MKFRQRVEYPELLFFLFRLNPKPWMRFALSSFPQNFRRKDLWYHFSNAKGKCADKTKQPDSDLYILQDKCRLYAHLLDIFSAKYWTKCFAFELEKFLLPHPLQKQSTALIPIQTVRKKNHFKQTHTLCLAFNYSNIVSDGICFWHTLIRNDDWVLESEAEVDTCC